MNPFKRTPQTLAIVGNGFDLNHGYKTDFKSFAENTKSLFLDEFREYCQSENITSWYLFEENMRILSERVFLKSMSENCNFDNNRQEVAKLTDIFKGIHVLLKYYLIRETFDKPILKNPHIAKYLNADAVAINFNYTKTVETYTKNVIYVHGSLEEDYILLGYDYRDEPCLAQFEDMRWSKRICRESLAFRRYFLGKKKYDPQGRKYKALLSGLEGYQQWENTGRGLDEEAESFIPEYRTVNKFLKKYRSNSELPKLQYQKIRTIAVLGHGIEADKVYLNDILKKCKNLHTVVIYRFAGESDESYFSKTAFFRPHCKEVEQINY